MEFTHIANPVRVTAIRIRDVIETTPEGTFSLTLENGEEYLADPAMLARYRPVSGDYVVRQEDGYEYLNPKDVFERKYRVIGAEMAAADKPKETSLSTRSRATEDDLRAMAPEYGTRHYASHDEAVKAAEAYYQFLKGASIICTSMTCAMKA